MHAQGCAKLSSLDRTKSRLRLCRRPATTPQTGSILLKIVHLITRLILGGAQKNTVMCCRHQVDRGHEVHLIYGPDDGPEGTIVPEALRSGATLYQLLCLRRSVLPAQDLRSYLALRKLLARIKPDIVHTHSSKAGIVGRFAARAARVPVVIHTVHGLAFHDQQPRWVSRGYINLERMAAKRCHHMVGITQPMVDLCLAAGIGRPEQYSVIPSGVDERTFCPPEDRTATRREVLSDLGLRSDGKVVGIVARLDSLKGHADLLNILGDLRRRLGEVHLLCVGDGRDRAALEHAAIQAGISDHVTWLGLVAQHRIPKLLAAMDCMVLPSYQEGQSRTLVEALMCGTPVVGYRVGGIPEVCVDEQTGLLAPAGDRDHLRAQITRLLESPKLAAELADNGRRHCIERFSSTIMLDRLDDLYQRLAVEKNVPGVFQAGAG